MSNDEQAGSKHKLAYLFWAAVDGPGRVAVVRADFPMAAHATNFRQGDISPPGFEFDGQIGRLLDQLPLADQRRQFLRLHRRRQARVEHEQDEHRAS